MKGNFITRFEFNPKKNIERDEEGRIISEFVEFYLDGIKDRRWMLLDVLEGIKEIAGRFEEEIYASDNCKVSVRTYSEATEELEKPRTKAIYIEDYSGGLPKVVVYFPYLRISEEEMMKAIDSSIEKSKAETRQHKERLRIPQSVRTKVLVRAKGKCEKCDGSLGNVKPHIHHKDGDTRNNRLPNLIVLCPNCHSNTKTFKNPKARNPKQGDLA